jgi:hypothetical protein
MLSERGVRLIKAYVLYGYYTGGTPYRWNSHTSKMETSLNKFHVLRWWFTFLYSTGMAAGNVINGTRFFIVQGLDFNNSQTGIHITASIASLFYWLSHLNHSKSQRSIEGALNACIQVFTDIRGTYGLFFI